MVARPDYHQSVWAENLCSIVQTTVQSSTCDVICDTSLSLHGPVKLPAATFPPVMQVVTPDLNSQPLDSNEPMYCICHQVSFGKMISCDNPEVHSLESTQACNSRQTSCHNIIGSNLCTELHDDDYVIARIIFVL